LLTRSFIQVPRVGPITERKLWDCGICSWHDLLSRPQSAPVGPACRDRICIGIERSQQALRDKDWMFFYSSLPSSEQWRMLSLPAGRTAYLDIETTGLTQGYDRITCIGLYDGQRARAYVRGRDLEQFAHDIQGYDLLVTYNGKSFDLPFIRRELRVALDVPHVDLRHVCASVGLHGGLKGAERLAGIKRSSDLDGVDGFVAVMLWAEYEKSGDPRALETLIAYNLEDTINLLPLSQAAWNRKLPARFPELRVKVCASRPRLPCRPDKALVRRLVASAGAGRW